MRSPASPTAAWRTWRGACSTAFPGSFRAAACMRRWSAIRCDARSSQLPPPAQRFALRGGAIRVLVLGGSQGAARLNAMVPFALARAALRRTSFDVRHQCRRALARGRAAQLRRGRRERAAAAVHRRHGRGLRLGGPGDLPRRRADDLGAGGGRRGRHPGAVSGGHRRSSDPQRRGAGRAPAPR